MTEVLDLLKAVRQTEELRLVAQPITGERSVKESLLNGGSLVGVTSRVILKLLKTQVPEWRNWQTR